MIQTIAKFLLTVFYYPFLPMRDPGTSYAPTVWAERERKGSNNMTWVLGWFFGVVSLVTYFKGGDAGGFAFLAMLVFFSLAFDWRTGLVVTGLTFLVLPWNLALVPIPMFAGWLVLRFLLEILAMDPWEWERLKQEEAGKKRARDAFNSLFYGKNKNRQ